MDEPRDPEKWAAAHAALLEAVGQRLLAAHHGVWPSNINIQYTVIQRNGKAKIQFSPSWVKEDGYKDA